jgi:NAD(P)-dependent dehydrogenase (short-subunit alcohol dehydrogenase family)
MILITGASKGIGKYLIEKFTKAGEPVFGSYHSTSEGLEHDSRYQKVDVSDLESVKQWIQNLQSELKQLVLINCAGINYNAFAHKADMDQWTRTISVNLIGSFNVIHEVLPFMRNEGFGRIINFSSIVAQQPIPGTSAYAASKSGLWGMTRSIAAENASKGITINNLNLGYFNLGLIDEVPLKFQESLKRKIPNGNFGDPKDILNAVRFIIDNDYLNGSSIDINGALN